MTDVFIFIFVIVKSHAFRASKSLLPPRCLYTILPFLYMILFPNDLDKVCILLQNKNSSIRWEVELLCK